MTAFAETLREFYDTEVLGEALYSGMLDRARNARERQVWGVLLQAETETKAWLRGPMTAAGVSLVERAETRERAQNFVGRVAPLEWEAQMQSLNQAIDGQLAPRFRDYAQAARERGEAEEEAVCLHMIEHEEAQVELIRRELAGEPLEQVLAPVRAQLRYPLPG